MQESKLVAAFILSLIIFNSAVFAEDTNGTGSIPPGSGGGSGSVTTCTNPVALMPYGSCLYLNEANEYILISYNSWIDEGNLINVVLGVNSNMYTKGEGSTITLANTIITIQDIESINTTDGEYPQVTISFQENSASVETPDNSSKSIIIWNADVGAWWSVDSAIYVTDYIMGRDVPVTVGVIPITGGGLYELGTDSELVNYLKGIKTESDVEIALEGLRFEDSEFYGRTAAEVTGKVNQGKGILSSSLFVEPDTFMPPYFVHDYNALEGARDAGISYFTAGWNAIEEGYAFTEHPEGLNNIPITTDTYNWDTGSMYTAEEIESSCQDAMDAYGTCSIIFQHHQFANTDGTIDTEKVQVLSDVLDWVKAREEDGVTLRTVSGHTLLAEPEPEVEKGIIVFRNDDIAPFWNVDIAVNLTETIRQAGVPQVLSIIPVDYVGDALYDDAELMEYLNSIKGDSNIELALHGYNHEQNEFETIGNVLTYQKLTSAMNVYRYAFNGEAPTSFVPPYNLYNSYTLYNLLLRNFNVISAGYSDIESGLAFRTDSLGIMHAPQTTDFYDWGAESHFTADEIISSCEYSLSTYGGCVLVVHHSLFVDSDGNIDVARMKILGEVIDWAKEKQAGNEAELALLRDIVQAQAA